MKRLIMVTILVAALSSFVMAKDRCAAGAFWVMKDNVSAGFGEWSFPICKTQNDFYVRDCINMGGFGIASPGSDNSLGGFILGNRIQFGGIYHCSDLIIRTYGFAGASFGIFSGDNHKPFEAPFMTGGIGGGGFEIQYSDRNAFCVEFGGDYTGFAGSDYEDWKDYNTILPVLILGFRSYY